MKKLYFVFLLFPFLGESQSALPKNERGEVEYSEIIQIDSAPSSILINRAKLFVTEAFKSENKVSQTSTDPSQEIEVKGLIPVFLDNNEFAGDVQFSLTIACRNNCYGYSLNSLNHLYIKSGKYLSGGYLENEKPLGMLSLVSWNKIKSNTSERINTLIYSLRNYMQGIQGSMAKQK